MPRLSIIQKSLLCLVLWTAQTAFSAEIRKFAGTGEKGFSGDGGAAVSAQLNNPFGLVQGPDGAFYVCDTDNHRVRRIDAKGTIGTFAGTGAKGYSGDGGPATAAQLNEPYEVRFDRAGNLYVVERMNHAIRRIDAKSGIITTVAGTGREGFSGDGGPAVAAQLKQPHSIAIGPDGNLYVCDILNHRVRKIESATGTISTVLGTGEKKVTPEGKVELAKAPVNGPRAIEFAPNGELWLALREGNAVYAIDLAKSVIRHVAGTGKSGFTGNGGPALSATLSGPKGLSIAPNGNVYLADTESHSIRMIDVAKGTLELVAGTGERGSGPDGDPLKCKFSRPHGVFVARDGAVFVGDSEAHCVRVIKP